MEEPFVREATQAELVIYWDQYLRMVGTFEHFKETEAALGTIAAQAKMRGGASGKILYCNHHVRHAVSAPIPVSSSQFGAWLTNMRLEHEDLRGKDAFRILADRAKKLHLKKSLQSPAYLRALERGNTTPTTWPMFYGIAVLWGTLPQAVAHMSVARKQEILVLKAVRKVQEAHAS